jgi:CHAT domain-containing protein
MSDRLKALTQLLPVPKLPDRIQRVWLVPHRDLHLFPLHTLFPAYACAYIPSVQTMRRSFPSSTTIAPFNCFSLESTNTELEWVNLQGINLVNHFDRLQRIQVEAIILEELPDRLSNAAETFHYAGHGIHDFNRPTQSGLQLTHDKIWTVGQIFKTDLQQYQRAILCACEIAPSESANIIADYVGIGSAMLGAGVGCVISPLWAVEQMAASVFILEFYRRLQSDRQDEAKTLLDTSVWLSQLTNADLCNFIQKQNDLISSQPESLVNKERMLITRLRKALKNELESLSNKPALDRPYSDRYYTSAFICQGTPKSI